jgi:hypothetical protein
MLRSVSLCLIRGLAREHRGDGGRAGAADSHVWADLGSSSEFGGDARRRGSRWLAVARGAGVHGSQMGGAFAGVFWWDSDLATLVVIGDSGMVIAACSGVLLGWSSVQFSTSLVVVRLGVPTFVRGSDHQQHPRMAGGPRACKWQHGGMRSLPWAAARSARGVGELGRARGRTRAGPSTPTWHRRPDGSGPLRSCPVGAVWCRRMTSRERASKAPERATR